MDIRNDQMVWVYENGSEIFSGLWENASEEIKSANYDWFVLGDVEYADILVIIW